MQKLSWLDWLTLVLLVIGGLNWGLIGLLKYDLVATIFGDMSGFSRTIYTLVGLSAVYVAVVMSAFAKKQ